MNTFAKYKGDVMGDWAGYVPLRNGLDEFEKEFNVSLPDDLKEIIQKYNKGCPLKNKIPLEDGKYTEIYRLISFNKTGTNNIYSLKKLFEDPNIVPFAMTEDNKYLCLNENKIVLYKMEAGIEKEICSSITELLQILY